MEVFSVSGETYDYWVIKLHSNGEIQWQNSIGGNDHDFLYSIKQTSDGGYILGGWSGSEISGDKIETNFAAVLPISSGSVNLSCHPV